LLLYFTFQGTKPFLLLLFLQATVIRIIDKTSQTRNLIFLPHIKVKIKIKNGLQLESRLSPIAFFLQQWVDFT